MSAILDDYLPYTDQFGLIQPSKNEDPSQPASTSGNGVLYSAEAIVAWSDNGILDDDIKKMWQAVYARCEIEPGLLDRAPSKKDDQEGPDDFHGAALASAFMDKHGDFACRILYYGEAKPCTAEYDDQYEEDGTVKIWKWEVDRKKLSKFIYRVMKFFSPKGIRYIYNEKNPGKWSLSAWVGRFPAVIASLVYATGNKPNLFNRLVWGLSLAIGTPDKNNHDSWILPWTRVRTWENKYGKGLIERVCVKIWRKKFKQVWGNPGDLLEAYFQNPNHPNAVYLKKSS